VNLRNQERARPGDQHGDGSSISWIEGADRHRLTVNECGFESLGASGDALAIWSEPSAASARAGQRFGNHQVDVDAVGVEPAAGVLAGGEATRRQEVG